MFRVLSDESDPNHGAKVDNCTMDSLMITVRCKRIMEIVANNAGDRAQHHEEVNIWKGACGGFRIQTPRKPKEFPSPGERRSWKPQLSAQSSIEYIP